MIYADAELADGMYNINNGKLFKYKAKGGSVRVHEIKRLVRCKDCKHRYYADNRVPHERTWVCERFSNEETTDNDFCSFGERSEE